jgi:hypothetical protein
MSTATIEVSKPSLTLQQVSQENTQKIAELLGVEDLKLLNVAVLEATLQEIDRNEAFAQRIKDAFAQLPKPKTKNVKLSTKAAPSIHNTRLVPIATVENYRFDPEAPPDPFFLKRLYGMHQLQEALDEFSVKELKRSVAEQMALHPNTKPKSKTKKEDIIEYLIDLVKSSQGAE